MNEFYSGLENGDVSQVRSVSKADLHNHCLLGIRLEKMRELSGLDIQPFRYKGNGIKDINQWIQDQYIPVIRIPGIFQKLIEASFQQALDDGITVLEMSFDAAFGLLYKLSPQQIVDVLKQAHLQVAPSITFRPCLGFVRSMPVRQLLQLFEPYLDLDYFTAIDLYDDELSQPVQNFREIYRFARQQGFRCTAHVGEFGSAGDVREAVEVLNLDAVQHGIAAASSPEVMQWLADRKVPLNICPTSNLVLQRAPSYAAHPIRTLFDHGVKVTVNTDDVTLFNQGVSEEYLNLYQAGLFSAEELDEIREYSLLK